MNDVEVPVRVTLSQFEAINAPALPPPPRPRCRAISGLLEPTELPPLTDWAHQHHDLIAEIPKLAERYPDYSSYGGQSVQQIFLEGELSNTLELQATELRSMIFWNEEEAFRGEALPMRAQLAPMYGIHLSDLTGDGADEILMGGNLYHVKPQAGPYDASRGVVIGYENGILGSYPPQVSGISVNGEIRAIKSITNSAGGRSLMIIRYDNTPLIMDVVSER